MYPSRPIIIDKLKLVYVPIAKSASSAVKLAILDALGRPWPIPLWTIHDGPFPCADTWPKDFTAFTVVRNPWHRLHSVWVDKFHPDRFQEMEKHHQLNIDMSFPEFIGALENIDLLSADEHIRPQACLISPYLPVLTMHMEALSAEWPAVMMRRGMGPLPPNVNHTEHDAFFAYDRTLTKKVGGLYAMDALKFGYDGP